MKKEFPYHKNKKKNYFEGWYYKNAVQDQSYTIAFIPGVTKEEAFLQVIDSHHSYYLPYSLDEVSFTDTDVWIGPNHFTENQVELHLDGALSIHGTLSYKNPTPIKKSWYAPTIMGPFSYFPMQCNHSVLSMHHEIYGSLEINQQIIDFEKGHGYLEKDYGTSFPKEYCWCQASGKDLFLFFSNAHIPIGIGSFSGTIAIFKQQQKEIHFASYYGCKTKIEQNGNQTKIRVKQGKYQLEIEYEYQEGHVLTAPKVGQMKTKMKETIEVPITLTLFEKQKKIVQETLIGSVEQVKKTP